MIGVTRGVDGTLASSHASGAAAAQYQCNVVVDAGVPTIATSSYARELQWGVQLQDGIAVANRNGNNFVLYQWNGETELSWADDTFASCGSSCRANLAGVSMLSYSDIWVVGDRTSGGALSFLHWDGLSWTVDLSVSVAVGKISMASRWFHPPKVGQ